MTTTRQQIRAARERAGLTQEQLGRLVGVTHRTVGNWERGASVPRNRLAKIREVLPGLDEPDDTSADLRSASDAEVLAEIARRFARDTERGEGRVRAPSMNDAEGTSATGESDSGGDGSPGPRGSGPSPGEGIQAARLSARKSRGTRRATHSAGGRSGQQGPDGRRRPSDPA